MNQINLTRKQIVEDPWYKRGEKAKALEIAKSLKNDDIPLHTIAKNTGLSIDEVKRLKK